MICVGENQEKKPEEHNDEHKVEEVVQKVFQVDEYYPPNHIEKRITDPSLPSQVSQFQYILTKALVKFSAKRVTDATTYNTSIKTL